MFYLRLPMAVAIALNLSTLALANSTPTPATPIRPALVCPDETEQLMPLLLRDLPAYANRVAQRSFGRYSTPNQRPGVLILASLPDYGSLSLGPGLYEPTQTEDEPEQVFFTTLERQYIPGGSGVLLQVYHWAFLTRSSNQWRLALLFSSADNYPDGEPPSPPTNTSQGAIAQAMRLWLRDCAAGAVESMGDGESGRLQEG